MTNNRYDSLRRHYPDQVIRVEDTCPPLSLLPGSPLIM
jgi:hypothetical protein